MDSSWTQYGLIHQNSPLILTFYISEKRDLLYKQLFRVMLKSHQTKKGIRLIRTPTFVNQFF